MDELWQSAPMPAMRVWRAAAVPAWALNASATAWALPLQVCEADWQALAQAALAACGTHAAALDLTLTLGRPGRPIRCRAVPLADGLLLWLLPDPLVPVSTPDGETAEFLGRALVLADVSVWRVDLATRRIYYNERGFQQLGLEPTPEGVDLDVLEQLIHPEDRAAILRGAYEALSGHRVVDVIARLRNADGSWRTLLTRRVAYRDAAGEPLGLAGVSLDLSSLVAEREQTLQLQERMNLVADAVGLGLWSRDVETGVVEWNEQMFRIHHRAPSEGTPTLREWLARHVHPLDRARMEREQLEADGQWLPSYQTEFRIPGPGGEVRWVYSWARREKRMGRQMAFGVHIDITDRRSAEQELQRERARAQFALEAAGLGVWERDLEGTPLYWNERMYRLRGLDPGDPRPVPELGRVTIDPEDREELRAKTRRHIELGEPYEHEFRVRWPDGSWHWLATRGQAVRDIDGRPLAMTGVNWDITAQKEAGEVRREKERAEQASRAKSEFMARMSHELRTPLNAVLGFAQLLGEDRQHPPSPRQRERLDHIRRAGEHLLALIDDVLDLSRIEADQRSAELAPVALGEACHEAMQWLGEMARQHHVVLQCDAALPGIVRADRRQLGQILTNLLSNAIKYNQRGGWVRVSSARDHYDGAEWWVLSVADNGRGLTPEQMHGLFEPFERLGAEREAIAGTGIGLTIVRQLVEKQHGYVEVNSEVGVGSEFRVWLPAADGDGPVAETGAVDQSAARPAAGHSPAKLRVLCVEDNPVNMLLVRELFALRPAFELQCAEDGQSGIALAQAWRPDVVLLDLQLPDLHGAEVMRRLRAGAGFGPVRFVALSANAMPDDVQAALAQGFDDYWTKPIEVQSFLARLDALAQAVRS
jgi:PAS domain S-box-containing protein